MGTNDNNINERSKKGENKVSEGIKFVIPREGKEGGVVKANTMDDVEEMAEEIDEAIGLSKLETYDDEKNYSLKDGEVHDKKKFDKLLIVFDRELAQKVGNKVFRTLKKVA